MVRVYLDMCCLKRPFDDSSEQRVQLENEAVLAILGAADSEVEIVHAPAHDLENSRNPVPARAARVQEWLEAAPLTRLPERELAERTADLVKLGFKSFDAFHIASAEASGARALATCDDQFLATARRHTAELRGKVQDPVGLAREILK
jgi:hypothetical protein